MNNLRLIVATVVTFVWAAVWIAAIISGNYGGVGGVTPVMLGIVGYLFAREWASVRKNGNGKKEK